MNQAFILGAGLGTRLLPLTHRLPKPLVPLFHRPLAEWAFAACAREGINRFAVNTHHLPEAWSRFGTVSDSPSPAKKGANGQATIMRTWQKNDVTLFHEPTLLDTGGGLKNISSWIGDDPLLIHNGDIFSTLPLENLIAAHNDSGRPVTLAMRTNGAEKRIALDSSLTRAIDVRELLGRSPGTHVFTGIYCVNPEFLSLIPPGEIVSVIPAFVSLAKQGRLGATVIDDGVWLDLGDRTSYLQAHRDLDLAPPVHADAILGTGCIVENSVIGPGAEIAPGAIVRDSVIWPGARVAGNASLQRCIVYSETPASGTHQDADL